MVKIILIAVLCLLLLILFLIAPGHASRAKKEPFLHRNFAHRGLYEKDQSIPENSIPAFKRAVKAGYGMELDVQLSRDGQVVVFHDDDLKRGCNVDKRVDELTFDELQELRIFESDEKIPLFTEVLKTVGGREPLIVELKNGRRNNELCTKTLEILKGYNGIYCIESFNPFITAWFRFHAPKILRGYLCELPEVYVKDKLSPVVGALLGRAMFNFASRPEFIAHKIGKKTLFVHIAECLGAVKVAWTSHDKSTEQSYDAVIFEHYRPEIKYR